ncbi:MAG: hypothetical protein MZV63_29855 [Marinilabiliales bacterium]|nr:hypothetical protein [Marinilabiliales bacterium]
MSYIQNDLGINDFQIGLACLSQFTLAIGLLTFPVSLVIDRWSRTKTIGIMADSMESGHCFSAPLQATMCNCFMARISDRFRRSWIRTGRQRPHIGHVSRWRSVQK